MEEFETCKHVAPKTASAMMGTTEPTRVKLPKIVLKDGKELKCFPDGCEVGEENCKKEDIRG